MSAAGDVRARLDALAVFPNLVTMFLVRAAERGEAPFLHRKRDVWEAVSWAEAARQVAALARTLRGIGLVAGDRVMLVSENRPEWCIADLAIMAAGCVTVPAYTTNTSRDHAHVLGDSGARAAIVSTRRLADALLPAVLDARACEHVVAMEPLGVAQRGSYACHAWDDLVAGEGDPAAVAVEAAAIGRDALACIIYTSGTGGSPRGVMQHHGAILHNVRACAAIIAEDFGWGEELFLSFLPLGHAYEHSAGQHLAIGLGAGIAYAESLEKLAANMIEVRPTIMVVVPRLFELLRARITRAIEKKGGAARWLLGAAERQAERPRRLGDLALDALLERALRRTVRARFGGRLKAFVSGGAPLAPEVGRFFAGVGITVLQGYGQTEAAPVIACNRPAAGIDMASVGPPLQGVELRIAADGEIMVRGPNVMTGYWRDDVGTRQAIDRQGWLATGDIGRLDAAGRLVITDRKKDILVNDKGDNIAPQRIEGLLTLEPEIGQAMAWGDRRPYLVALLVPDEAWLGEAGLEGEALRRALQAAVDRVNARLSVVERVRRILVADEGFTIANGQLTPSLKLRRHVLRDVYGARLEALYLA